MHVSTLSHTMSEQMMGDIRLIFSFDLHAKHTPFILRDCLRQSPLFLFLNSFSFFFNLPFSIKTSLRVRILCQYQLPLQSIVASWVVLVTQHIFSILSSCFTSHSSSFLVFSSFSLLVFLFLLLLLYFKLGESLSY